MVPGTGGTRPPEVSAMHSRCGYSKGEPLPACCPVELCSAAWEVAGQAWVTLSRNYPGEFSYRMTTKQIFATRTSKRVKEELPDAAARYLWPRLGVDQQTGERDIEA